jgi:hypothetical protein
MFQSGENEEEVVDVLQQKGFKVSRERIFGHKWIVDLVGERGDTVLLVEFKSGAPVSNADIFDFAALRKSGQFRNKNTRCFILNTGAFQLDRGDPIMKVAEAGDVKIIHGETFSAVMNELNSQIVGSQS